MRIKIFLKKLVIIGVAVLLTVAPVGCFDLGDFSDESAYYAAFGDVGLVYQNPKSVLKDIEREDYSVKDYFYNKNTGEDFVYGDPKDEEPDEGKDIPQLSYVYMVIPVEQDLNVESLALYFNALQTCSLDILFYVVDDLPNGGDFSDVWLLGEPEYQQKLDENKNPMVDENGLPIYGEEKVEYSDPDDSFIVGKATANLKKDEWISLVMDSWNTGKFAQISKGQHLLLRFVNNSGANTGKKPSVAFRVTNLLIRAVS